MVNNITSLREKLFETLDAVKNGTMEINRANAVANVGSKIIETAKVELDFLRLAKKDDSLFIDPEVARKQLLTEQFEKDKCS